VANVPELAVNAFPPNAEIETASTMALSGSDRYVGLVQLLALAFACIAIAGVARRLGFDRRAALFGALAFSTYTVVMLQASTALNDLVVASLLITCVYFALGSTHTEFALGALGLALALGTKLTTVFALPALVVFVLASQPRRRWATLALYGAVGVAAGSLAQDFEIAGLELGPDLGRRFTAGLEIMAAALRGEGSGPLAGDPAIQRCRESPVPLLSAASCADIWRPMRG